MTTPEPAPPATARDLVAALDRHYLGPPGGKDTDSHATWQELADPAGKRIDYLALRLWASRGDCLDGHEIKVSRSDWLTELGKPAKADGWWAVCNRWWLVVSDAAIVQDGELPPGWGLMVPPAGSRRSMKVIVPAPVREPAWPLWLTRVLVKRDRTVSGNRLRSAVTTARYEGMEAGRREVDRERDRREGKRLTRHHEERLQVLAELEQLLGCPIEKYAWREQNKLSPDLAAAAIQVARALTDLGGNGVVRGVDDLLRCIGRVSEAATEVGKARTALDRVLSNPATEGAA